jgi:hypothetical protein
MIVAENEQYRADSEKVRQKAQARNVLESYIYDLRNAVQVSFLFIAKIIEFIVI